MLQLDYLLDLEGSGSLAAEEEPCKLGRSLVDDLRFA